MSEKLLILSNGIRKIPFLASFLPEYRLYFRQHSDSAAVAGWGYKPTAKRARTLAKQRSLPYLALEDGFLRSSGLGVKGYPPLALVADPIGIYYDTSRPSYLEQLILAADKLPEQTVNDAERAIQLICAYGLSKYNQSADFADSRLAETLPENDQTKRILVIDQTFGDMAVHCSGADETTFAQMLAAARAENPDAEIWVKIHPDVLCGKRRGYLSGFTAGTGIRLVAEDINPISLIKQIDKVYCVSSQMGFEALMCGKPVITFGLPWYAGWGISDDRHSGIAQLQQQKRRATRTLTQLFAAAYLQYSRYINPNNGEPGTIFDLIAHLHKMRTADQLLRGDIYCIGISLWKRAVMKPFFRQPSCRLHFVASLKKMHHLPLPPKARLLVWGNGKEEQLEWAAARGMPILRMEDGFIRSVGLGSNLVPPLSLVIDDLGIYFNAQTPSRLEYILQNYPFDEADRATAEALRQTLTEADISKYNVGSGGIKLPETAQKILLVPGQVEDDASIRLGSPKIKHNLDLLRLVRQHNPQAYIIYKPHPDVVSGNRVGKIAPADCLLYADQIAEQTDISACLKIADEVHTMTSLTGFEALLRGKTVYCYGQPFYAGWGLTQDQLPPARRNRKLALWQLIAGVLIHYPSYIHPDNRHFIDAPTAAALIRRQKQQNTAGMLQRNWFAKQFAKLKQLYISITR